MGEEALAGSPVTKHSHWTKAEMVVFKAEKAVTKEARKAKKLAN
jgi:hypothetical protein